MVISLKFQMNNRKNALNVESAKGKTGEKGCIFHRTVEMKQPHTITEPKEKALRGKRIALPARSPYENGSVLKGRSFPPVYGKIAVPCHKSLGNVLPLPHKGKAACSVVYVSEAGALPPVRGKACSGGSPRNISECSSPRTRESLGIRIGNGSALRLFPPHTGKAVYRPQCGYYADTLPPAHGESGGIGRDGPVHLFRLHRGKAQP